MIRKGIIIVLGISTAFAAGLYFGSASKTAIEYIPNDSIPMLLRKNDSLAKRAAKLPDKIDTIVNDEFEIVTHHPEGYVKVLRRYTPKKLFEDYPVNEKYTGSIPSQLDFSTCTYGKRYKTRTYEALDYGVAFAGYYSFAAWGCGSNCQSSSIIDLRTGKVYAGPDAGNGFDFRVNSKLLVVNPPDTNGLYDLCAFCKPEQYLWTGSSFKRLE